MREVGDGDTIHLQIDLHSRAAQLGVRRGGCIGIGQPAQTGDVAGQLDDPFVVDVVQHVMGSEGVRPASWRDRPWRPSSRVLYRIGTGGKTVRKTLSAMIR